MADYKIPGIYSDIDASAALKSLSANDYVIGIVAQGTADDTTLQLTNKAYAPTSFEDAKLKYGSNSKIIEIMNAAIDNGGKKFIVVRTQVTAGNPDYSAALAVLELEEAVDIVVTDAMNSTHFTTIKTHVATASANRKERTAVVGVDVGTDLATVKTNSAAINSNRVFIAYPNPLDASGNEVPGYIAAAAIAGQLAAEADPSMPMTGVELFGFYGLSKKLRDSEMEQLIDSGVIPLETRNGSIRIVRCITTYTKNAQGVTDITWQEATTIRVSDYVFKDMREGLALKFSRSKQNKYTRDSIKSEVLTRLLSYQGLEYIENVSPTDVTIEINPSNPLRNDVKFKYDVTGPVNVIHLTGYLVI